MVVELKHDIVPIESFAFYLIKESTPKKQNSNLLNPKLDL